MYEKSIENVKKGIDNDKVKWYPILISTDLYKGGTLVNLLKEAGVWRHIEQIQLQQTIGITENGKIHMMMFMHPIIVDDNNHREFIEFANAANLWLGSSLGRFWINQDNDFCYECYLPKLLIDHLEELEQQLFDKPFSHFRDCLTPLLQLKDGKWTVDKAIKYINELRTEGFIDKSEYGLW